MLKVSSRRFANHAKVAVIGSGSGGGSVISQLYRSGKFAKDEIIVFDPSTEHWYQPSLTMIGGGVLGSEEYHIRKQEYKYLRRPMEEMIHEGVRHRKEAVVSINPDENRISTETQDFTYDYLVVSTGIELDLDRIPGMRAALDDPKNPAGTIYSHKYVYKVLNLRNEFTGGKAVFMNPMQPIKCGGAPQKIMYLSDYEWREKGLFFTTKFVSATPILFPACMKFSDSLNAICEERKIERSLGKTI